MTRPFVAVVVGAIPAASWSARKGSSVRVQHSLVAMAVMAAIAAGLAVSAWLASTGAARGSVDSEIFVANSITSGRAAHSILLKVGDTVQAGDFTGDGADGFAARAGARVTMVSATGALQGVATYGKATDSVFLTGDWNGDGTDGFAIVRGNVIFQRQTPTSGRADNVFVYGRAGDTHLSGDFDGDGVDTIAVRRGKQIHMRNSNTSSGANVVMSYGRVDDAIVFGDFDGDQVDTPAAQRRNLIFIRNSNTTGRADRTISLGRVGDWLMAGDFDGTSTAAAPADTFALRRELTEADSGTITIAVSSKVAGVPAFQFGGDLGRFELTDGTVHRIEALPGTYRISQIRPAATWDGQVLLDLSCADSDPSGAASRVALDKGRAIIRLDRNERVRCHFVNGPPNIMLLVSDDQGYLHHGFMGNDLILTPNLDRLASESLVFPRGFTASSLCTPSHVSMLTGYEWLQFVWRNRQLPGWPDVDPIPRMEPIAAVLGDAGYASYLGGKWWFGPPANSGFTSVGPGSDEFGRESIASLLTFLDEHRGEPSYVYFAPELPHTPWDAPQEIYDRYDGVPISDATRQYYSNVTRFDDRIGEILDYLDRHDLRQSTLLIFTTDNGWQQGPLDPDIDRGGDHGKLSPYELGFRTPMLFSLPGVIDPGTNTELVTMADLYPTTLSVAGVARPEGRIGLDLKPALIGSGDVARDAIVGMTPVIRTPGTADWTRQNVFYYRNDAWRYIWWAATGHHELYRIATDPFETNDVVARHPTLAAAFRAEIDAWKASLAVSPATLVNTAEPACLAPSLL